MKKGESRFFLNWQLTKEDQAALFKAGSDQDRTQLLEQWITRSSGLMSSADVTDESHWAVIINYFEGHYDFARRSKFTEAKMGCLLEIMLYLLKQLLASRLSEERSFEMFKELLVRHSVQRPPHSLAIFNADDVKAINEHVQDTLYRFYNMYLYALTKDQLITLTTEKQLELDIPLQTGLAEGKQIAAREVDKDIRQFLSAEELVQLEKENEYMTKGPGRIERIMREEMDKLASHMEEKIRAQDEDFLNRLAKK